MYKTIQRLLRRKYLSFITVAVITFAVIGEMYHFFVLSTAKSMVISLNYPGAEEGLNPDGSRFNISELTCDEILDNAKANLKMKKQTNDSIRSHMYITTKFSRTEMDSVLDDIKSDSHASYVPTSFYLSYSQKNKLAKNESYEFLESLAKSYEDYFNKNHAENNSILHFDKNSYDFSDYDYTEIYRILYDRADRMASLLNLHRSENRAFRSDDNINFATMKDELDNFRDVKLEKFNAYVVQNRVSKNRGANVDKLKYLMDKSGILYNKKHQASDIAKSALEKYDPKITAVAFIPAFDNTRSFYMSRTKTGIDDIAKNSYEDGMDASRISKKLDSYNNNYQKLSQAPDSTAEQIKYADEYLASVIKDFTELSEKIVKLDDEYLGYKTESYFNYQINKKSGPVDLMIIIKFILLGLFLSLIIIVYMEFFYALISRKTATLKQALLIMTKYRK
uniref:Uncharacterized protein n=1 Tax=uncultured Bacillota bacterium TaxID=344338 RepID=A0A650ENW9_9FIRM|nr:hypothetical protein Firmicute1046_3420 [uncultured Firmicutes bacterium]